MNLPIPDLIRRSKYGSIPTTIDGIRFASRLEAKRYSELALMERAGAITGLVRQQRYRLIVNDILIATYVSDFDYYEQPSKFHVVEDCKGVRTQVYKLKVKLLYAIYGITISEITK